MKKIDRKPSQMAMQASLLQSIIFCAWLLFRSTREFVWPAVFTVQAKDYVWKTGTSNETM